MHLYLALFILLAGSVVAQAKEVASPPEFLPDLATVLETARAEDRPVLAYFTSPGCIYCTQLRDTVFVQREVQSAMSRFELAEINLASDRETVMRYNVRGFPTLLVLAPNGKERARQAGFIRGPELTTFLKNALGGVEAPPDWEKRLADDTLTAEDWPQILLALSDPSRRQSVRKRVLRLASPDVQLVEGLGHQQLAVRLAAIELLEERTGSSRGFDPFADPESPSSRAARLAWLEDSDGDQAPSLDPERVRAAVADLGHSDPLAQQRAARLLAMGGPVVNAVLADALASDELSAGARRQVNTIQLGFLIDALPKWDGPATAHRLVHANLDIRIDLLRRLAQERGAAPILQRFSSHPEALLREVALESLASDEAGHAQLAVALEKEENLDVLIASLRALKKVPSKTAFDLLIPRLGHENEDVVLTALDSLEHSEAAKRMKKELPQLVDDPRWRIRARVFEWVTEVDQGALLPEAALSKGIRDEDAFVRRQALSALIKTSPELAKKEMRQQFLEDDEAKMSTFPLLASFNSVDEEIIAAINSQPRETQLEILRMMRDDSHTSKQLALAYANHADDDLAVFGLAELCRTITAQPTETVPQVILDVLRGSNEVRVATVLRSVESLIAKNEQSYDYGSGTQLTSLIDLEETLVALEDGEATPEISIDELVNAFVFAATGDTNKVEVSPLDFPKLTEAVRPWLTAEDELGDQAARLLLPIGEENAFDRLSGRLYEWPTPVRERFYTNASEGKTDSTRRVLKIALADPELPARAVRLLLSHDMASDWIDLYLDYLDGENLSLPALADIPSDYGYNLNATAKKQLREWAMAKLGGSDVDRIRGLLLLTNFGGPAGAEPLPELLELLEHEDVWTRRLVAQLMAKWSWPSVLEHLDTILNDPSDEVVGGFVRLVADQGEGGYVTYKMDENSEISDYVRSGDRKSVPEDHLESFHALLKKTENPLIQIDLFLLLLRHQVEVEVDQLRGALAAVSDPAESRNKVLRFFASHSLSLPDSVASLVKTFLDDPSLQDYYKKSLLKRFPELAPQTPAAVVAPPPTGTPSPESAAAKEAASAVARLLVFYREGCSDCTEVATLVSSVGEIVPGLVVERFDVDTPEGEGLQRKLIAAFSPDFSVGKAPAIFAASGVLAGEDIKPAQLIDLTTSSEGIPRSEWDPRLTRADDTTTPAVSDPANPGDPGDPTRNSATAGESGGAAIAAIAVVTGPVTMVTNTDGASVAGSESADASTVAQVGNGNTPSSAGAIPVGLLFIGLIPLLLLLGRQGWMSLFVSIGIYGIAVILGLFVLKRMSVAGTLPGWEWDLIAAFGWLLPAFICLHRALAPSRDVDPVRRPAFLGAILLGLLTAFLATSTRNWSVNLPFVLALVLAGALVFVVILGPLRHKARHHAWPWWASSAGFVLGYAVVLTIGF